MLILKETSLAIICLLVSGALSDFTNEDCAELGFIKASLLCSSCDQLDEFGLGTLTPHCRACCHRDESSGTVRKYARAILEVCTCKFPAYPQIQAFVKSDRPANFSNLQIKYVRGLDPIIKLLDRDGSVLSTVAIEKWNTDSVEEFLNTHLEREAEEDSKDYLKTNRI